jgi:eukaryotic-like serine/threonine-protein kinase
MLNEDGQPLVIDLGIAKIYSRLVPEGTVAAASAPFTPPELVGESPAMTRDTHAWAALTVFAVSGHDPYAAGKPYELLDNARDAARPKLPAAVAEIVERCLDGDGHRRPANGMVLAADVDAALERERRSSNSLGRSCASSAAACCRP